MLRFVLVLIVAAAAIWYFYPGALTPTSEHCSPAYIKQVADSEGLAKAKELSAKCLEEGFAGAKGALLGALEDAGSAVRQAGDELKKELLGK